MHKVRKYFTVFLFGLLILLVLLALFSQTPLFKSWLKNRLVAAIEEATPSQVHIGKLSGNLGSLLQMEKVRWRVEGQDFLRVKRILVHYRLLPLLLKRIDIRELIIEEPQFFLEQKADSLWNFRALLAGDTTAVGSASDTTSTFDWEIILSSCKITGLSARIQTPFSRPVNLPERIEDFDLAFALTWKEQVCKLELQPLHLQTHQPDLSLNSSKTHIEYGVEKVAVDNLSVDTDSSHVFSNVDVRGRENPVVNILLKTTPLSLAEIRSLFPDVHLYGSPKITLATRGRLSDLTVDCRVDLPPAMLHVSGKLQAQQQPFAYDLKGELQGFDFGRLVRDSSLTSEVNLHFELAGTGVEFGRSQAEFSVFLDSSRVWGKSVAATEIHAALSGDSLTFQTTATVERANFALKGELTSLQKQPAYDIRGQVEHFDFSRLANAPDLPSDFNLSLAVRGSGVDWRTMDGKLDLEVLPSSVSQIPLDSAQVHFSVSDGVMKVQRFDIRSAVGNLRAAGNLSFESTNSFNVAADFTDFSVLLPLLPVDSLSGAGHFRGEIFGPVDSLKFFADFDLQGLGAGALHCKTFRGELSGLKLENAVRGTFSGKMHGLGTPQARLSSCDFHVAYRDSVARVSLQLAGDEGFSMRNFSTVLLQPQQVLVKVDTLRVGYRQLVWEKAHAPTSIRIVDSSLDFSRFGLENGSQKIILSGRLDTAGESDLRLAFSGIDLATLQQVFEIEEDVGGIVDFELVFTGQMGTPQLDGKFALRNGHSYQVAMQEISGDFGYREQQFWWKVAFEKTAQDSLFETSGNFPVNLSFRPFAARIDRDRQLVFKMSTRGIDLSFLQPLAAGFENIQGRLVADIVINNTLNDLRGVGPIRLINGAFDIPELGTKYRKVNLALILQEQEVLLRDFRMHSGDGQLKVVDGSLSLSNEQLQTFNARFTAKDFQLMNNKKMKANVDGDLEVSGSIQAPRISGDLTITECIIHYEEWFEKEAVYLTTQPFFVISGDSAKPDTAGAIRFQKDLKKAETIFTETRFYKSLRGEISFYFPRNAWIRGGDTNIEIEGDLVAVKEGEDFVIFGSVSTIRGFYELLGNRFQIKKGELVFNGDPEYNPEISIEATYTVPSSSGLDGEKQEFEVKITGTMKYPEFHFTLDGEEVPQNDLVSILIFGKRYADSPLAQFGSSQPENGQAKDSGTGLPNRATGILAGQILKQISGKISDQLSLDMIQIERGKSWKEARVRVGKYLTPDVFVSVSQDFGDEGKQRVELEYEIPKILFFNLLLQASSESQGTSALDVIWKIEW